MAEKLGPYVLNRRIGAGGMADVFLAEGPRGVCVIKRPHPHLCANPDFLRMFLDEASLLAQLHHPGIAQIYDLGHVGDVYYLAMEYVPGFDLMTISLEHERQGELIGFELCARIVADAAAALHYAHDAKSPSGQPLNIIHRDVTPHNILLSTSGQVKLIDFGVARASTTTHRTQAGLVKGKYPYMSPEQITGQYIDRRVDVYALGLVLYEMLTNVRAIAGQTEVEQIDNARSARIRPIEQLRPNTPVPLRQIVASCLFPEVEGRYPSALAVKDDLEKYLAYDQRVVGREDLLRLFRVVAAEMRSDLSPTDGDAFSAARLTEQDHPSLALVLPEGDAHHPDDDSLLLGGSAPTAPSMKLLATPVKTRILEKPRPPQRQQATGAFDDPRSEPPVEEEPSPARATSRLDTPLAPPPRSKGPMVALGAVLLLGAAGFATRGLWNPTVTQAALDAGSAPFDAGAISPFVFPPEDAGSEPEQDASAPETSPFVDAGVVPQVATVHLRSDPAADVIIDRRAAGHTPLTVELTPGEHQIALVKASERFRRGWTVNLEAGEDKSLSVVARKGTLRIEVVPFATMKLNGEVLGASSYKELELYEGAYTLELELSDASMPKKITRRKQVTVKPGEQVTVKESMLP